MFIRDAIGQCADGISDLFCGPGTFKSLGNVSSGLIEVNGSVIGQENEFNLADPEARVEVTGANITLTLNCASAKNLRAAFVAETVVSDDGSFVEDFCFNEVLEEGDFYPFKFKGVNLDTLQVTLRNDVENTATLVSGVDYLASTSGVQIIRDDITIGDAMYVRLSYSYDTEGYESVEFMTSIPKYKEVYFKGINYGDEDQGLFDANVYRVLFAPVSGLDLITRDEFLSINLVGTIQKSNDKWFNITKQE